MMFCIINLILSVLALCSVVQAAPSSPGQVLYDVDDFAVVDLTWDLPIKVDDPNGEKMTVTGSIQTAIAKMEAAYPGWNATFQAGLPVDEKLGTRSPAALEDPTYNCEIRADTANFFAIKWGIHYLRGIDGNAKGGPGPRNCSRVSCSWNSAIYWCNDEVSWGLIADLADGVVDNCAGVMGVKGKGSYTKSLWSVILRSPKPSEGNC
ncbi:hypothetical protein QBC40DRAFT_344618 [Triangularia verruculosa]|uniref:Uncharacterized protein n=1 Tax=Triangularia verruculosa TaxID=2587418 RepID=A0AAN6XVR0_9PEZI|nr:hypothetical protein QBC40DRAFT_344618 [Triangularia verruculosa]